MSLITSYFKKDKTSVTKPPPSVTCDDSNAVETGTPACVVEPQVLGEDSNSRDAIPPRKMKIALFTVHEPTPNSSVNCSNVVKDHVSQDQPVTHGQSIEKPAQVLGQPFGKQCKLVEIQDECQHQCTGRLIQTSVQVEPEKPVTDTTKDEKPDEVVATMVSLKENDKKSESTAQAKRQQQARQTTLKFQNGKCILVPMEPEPVTGMETGSQESSQLESNAEDDYPPQKQQRKRRKKKKERSNIEDSDTASQDENITVSKKPCRKASREATERLNELLNGTVLAQVFSSPQTNSSDIETNIIEESVETKMVPQIVVEDNCVTCNAPLAADISDVMVSPNVAKDEAAGDSSDSDVICLTPRSASPLSQELQSSPSKPSTPAKNKWAHIFGVKSPRKKPSSPGRTSSPRKGSPRNSPRKTASQALVLSSVVSHKQYSLGVTLFYHVMQQDSSPLWNLSKVELPFISTTIKNSPLSQLHQEAMQNLDCVSKGLIAADKPQKLPFCLKVIVCMLYIV